MSNLQNPPQSFLAIDFLGTGTKKEKNTFLFGRVVESTEAVTVREDESASTGGARRIFAVRVVQPGLYHVSAGMRFGREDRIHVWGLTLDSQRSSERQIMNMSSQFVLARTLQFDPVEDSQRIYTTLSWTGVLARGAMLRTVGDSPNPKRYQGEAADFACYLRVVRLAG